MPSILQLKSITCVIQAETFTDELYLTFNGTKYALPDMTKGQTKALTDAYKFSGSPKISMFEDDGNHWYDRDDFIDTHTITEALGDRTLIFKAESGNAMPARYVLSATVTTDPPPAQPTAILRLNSITCLQQAETLTDELFVTFNGTKRSLPDMTQGQTKALNHEFVFSGSPLLGLFEDDGNHWYDRDDFIAQHPIAPSAAELTLDCKAEGHAEPAHYEINISVTPRP